MAKNKLKALHRYINNELTNLKTLQEEINEFYPTMGKNPPVYKIRAITSMLDDFYKGVERIFEKIA